MSKGCCLKVSVILAVALIVVCMRQITLYKNEYYITRIGCEYVQPENWEELGTFTSTAYKCYHNRYASIAVYHNYWSEPAISYGSDGDDHQKARYEYQGDESKILGHLNLWYILLWISMPLIGIALLISVINDKLGQIKTSITLCLMVSALLIQITSIVLLRLMINDNFCWNIIKENFECIPIHILSIIMKMILLEVYHLYQYVIPFIMVTLMVLTGIFILIFCLCDGNIDNLILIKYEVFN